MNFVPRRIYILRTARNYAVTGRITNYGPWRDVPRQEVQNSAEIHRLEGITVRAGQEYYESASDNIRAARSILVIKPGSYPIVTEERRRAGTISMDVYRLDGGLVFNLRLGGMCIFNCHYCYNYGANVFHPEVAVYSNTELMIRQMRNIRETSPDVPILFNAGEHTDSLALDPVTALTTDLVPTIPELQNTLMELRTKTADVENLQGLQHGGRTIVAFTLSPQNVIDACEGENAITVEERIEAMVRCQNWGYPIALKIDPVIPIDGWEEDYHELIEILSERLNPELIHHYSLGVLRIAGKLRGLIQELYPESPLLQMDFSQKQLGKYTHVDELRGRIYRSIINRMREFIDDKPFYLSMEERTFAEHIQ